LRISFGLYEGYGFSFGIARRSKNPQPARVLTAGLEISHAPKGRNRFIEQVARGRLNSFVAHGKTLSNMNREYGHSLS
jgi:hypothetical protein